MVNVEFKVLGVEETQKQIESFVKDTDRALALKMAVIVDKIAFDAKQLAPVRTGFLRDNITGRITRRRSFVEGRIRSGAPYSIFQEFGTSRHGAQPFMRPAFIQNIEFIERELGKTIIEATIRAEIRQGSAGRKVKF